jgi:DNA-binding transcriptional LysR family regulator
MTVISNDEAIIAARDGFGITRVMCYMVAPFLSSGELAEVLREHETSVLPVHIMHHEGRHGAQKVRAFIDMAVKDLRGINAVAVK